VPNRKALLIAIGYTGTRTLKSPWRDVDNLKALLIREPHLSHNLALLIPTLQEKYQYTEKNIIVLTDRNGVDDDMQPTSDNIVSSDIFNNPFPTIHITAGARAEIFPQ
jgi:hypothetical protein